jgi:catechol 2,3-dioxygenase-like lactoylglutathione lyase family enzyme
MARDGLTISGGCHCRRVRFRVELDMASPLPELLDCNCSICTMKGFLHLIVDERRFACDDHDALATYTFGTHTAKHMFCRTCGIAPFYRPRSHPQSWDINARCLDAFDRAAWRVVPFDGLNWESAVEHLRGSHADLHLELVTIVVDDYDPAIEFFVKVLGFTLVEDSPATATDGHPKRWVVVRPPRAATGILLARADGDTQRAIVGAQVAGRVGFFLRASDFDATHARLVAAGVEIVRPPRDEPYGRVLVFRDIGGNRWDLLGGLR